jgi:hypothetical protein
MAQKNRANMLTDIVSNIYNNLINFITGQNAQDRFVNLLDSSPNILSDASQANGYVSTDANNEMFSSYYDEEISRADLISDLTANLAVGGKFYRINDAVGTTITLLVTAESNINLYPFGIDATTGEIGTYDITTDVFTVIAGSGNANITTITVAALAALETAGTLSLTTIYIVTDATYRIAVQAEAANRLGVNGTIIDLTYAGSVNYDVQSNVIQGVAITDSSGSPNQWFGVLPIYWSVGGTRNVFFAESSGTLGVSSRFNTFEQSAANNILGDNCQANTFKQGANNFTFGNGLQNVTIEAGVTGADYTATPDYDFLYNNSYASTIFTDGTDNYHRYYDPANDRIVVTNLSTLAVSYIGGGTPNLQQVTDVNNSTTNNILVDDGANNVVTIFSGGVTVKTGSGGEGNIMATNMTNVVDFELPDKPAGTETFAMLSDITGGGGGGGASISYYLNGSVSQGTFGGVAMSEINKTPIIGTGTDFTIATNGYIQSFITDANDPNQLVIPAGNWNFETYFSASSGGGSPSFYIELHKWDGATLTLIASNSLTPEGITNGTAIDLYFTAIAVPQTTLALTDRLAIRIYVNNSGRTITLHTENSHLCQVITTFTTGLTALNGLTEQVQTFAVGASGTDFAISSASGIHNFNLPTASASNRGALSSADWSAFNSLNVENLSLQDGGSSIAATTYTLELYAQYAYTINQLKIISASGTCTVAVKINGVDVTGISAVSVSSTIATANASAANTVAVGDKITLVTTSNSALTNLQASLKTTRI